jgi:hypothetical protein
MASPANETELEKRIHSGRASSRRVTFRSFLLGTAIAALVCGIGPYNDYVVANTVLVDSYFPVALVLTLFLLIVLVNAPLHWLKPKWALSASELAVVLVILLGASAVAEQGLMRTIVPMLVAPFHLGLTDRDFWLAFTRLGLPHWLFPVGNRSHPGTSSIVEGFYDRLPADAPVPYRAWLVPLGGWGLFFGALFATLLAMAAIVGPQWAENERVSFPLAQVQLELIEPPEQGRALNALFRSRSFWFAMFGVIILHSLQGLSLYFPKQAPVVPLSYNLSGVFANEPWVHLSWYIKTGTIYFTFIGLTYFIPARVSFSLWASFLIVEMVNLQQSAMFSPISPDAWVDQHLGATIAFVIGICYVGRRRWWEVLRTLWPGHGRRRRGPNALPVPRFAAILIVLGPMGMMAWLLVLGVQWWVALLIVLLLLIAHLTVARVVAETGLPFIRSYVNPLQVVTNLPTTALTGRDVFFTGVFTMNGALNTRESLLGYAVHAEYIGDAVPALHHRPRTIVALIGWGTLLGAVVAAAASLHCYYRYATPLAIGSSGPLNPVATQGWPASLLASPLEQFAAGRFPAKAYNPWVHMSAGFVITGLLEIASLSWASWPFLPIGYLLASTWYIQTAWFCIFLGWLCKTVLVRFGGAKLYKQARPFFFGLVFGEALSAAIWMLVSLTLAWMGKDYKVLTLLPV